MQDLLSISWICSILSFFTTRLSYESPLAWTTATATSLFSLLSPSPIYPSHWGQRTFWNANLIRPLPLFRTLQWLLTSLRLKAKCLSMLLPGLVASTSLFSLNLFDSVLLTHFFSHTGLHVFVLTISCPFTTGPFHMLFSVHGMLLEKFNFLNLICFTLICSSRKKPLPTS